MEAAGDRPVDADLRVVAREEEILVDPGPQVDEAQHEDDEDAGQTAPGQERPQGGAAGPTAPTGTTRMRHVHGRPRGCPVSNAWGVPESGSPAGERAGGTMGALGASVTSSFVEHAESAAGARWVWVSGGG